MFHRGQSHCSRDISASYIKNDTDSAEILKGYSNSSPKSPKQ